MRLLLIIFFIIFSATHQAHATLISSSEPIIPFVDRNVLSFSDNQYTLVNGSGETVTGNSILVSGMNNLEWLPTNFSTNYSYADMLLLTQKGQEFENWRLASSADMVNMITIFMGGPIDFNMVFSSLNDTYQIPEWEGATDAMYPYFRDTFSMHLLKLNPRLYTRLGITEGYSYVSGHFFDDQNLTGWSDGTNAPTFFISQVSSARGNGWIDRTGMGDYISVGTFGGRDQKRPTFGSFLVKEIQHVNAPSAMVWLLLAGICAIFLRQSTFR